MRIALTLLTAGLLAAPLAALAQDDTIFQPSVEIVTPAEPAKPNKPNKAPPVPETSGVRILIGTWRIAERGNPTCGDGTVTFKASGASGVSGSTDFDGYPGTVEELLVAGDQVSFASSYDDVFGDPQRVTRHGTLSADRNTIKGKIAGSWQDGCTFIMTR